MGNLFEYLGGNTYPGRGILMGRSQDGEHAVMAYFIMGRSVNSRNRVFVPEGEGIRTQAYDLAKLSDPSLVIYAPVRAINGLTVVTNGDQTDTIVKALEEGGTFEGALRTRTFEPDGPNFTPRISGLMDGFDYKLSILKSAEGREEAVRRYFYEYPQPIAGEGHLIHTYRCDGTPIPSFLGEPVRVELEGDIDTFTQKLWNALNEGNRVSLFTRYIHVASGQWKTRIVNKHQG